MPSTQTALAVGDCGAQFEGAPVVASGSVEPVGSAPVDAVVGAAVVGALSVVPEDEVVAAAEVVADDVPPSVCASPPLPSTASGCVFSQAVARCMSAGSSSAIGVWLGLSGSLVPKALGVRATR